jgi:hypothetical protein
MLDLRNLNNFFCPKTIKPLWGQSRKKSKKTANESFGAQKQKD